MVADLINNTSTTIQTWVPVANVSFTSVSSVSIRTETEETIPLVLASGSILTRVGLTMVNGELNRVWLEHSSSFIGTVTSVCVFHIDTSTLIITR